MNPRHKGFTWSRQKLWLLGLLLAVACFSARAAPSMIAGVCVHMIDRPDDQDRLLDISQKIGFSSIRADATWKLAEKHKGQYQIPVAWDRLVDHALARNIQTVLIIAYGNPLYDNGDKPRSQKAIAGYANYAEAVVRHFRGRVKFFEIWNEWDTPIGGGTVGTPEEYAALFKATYPRLKRIAPDAVFIASSGDEFTYRNQTNWIGQLSRLGVTNMADGLAIHPYNYHNPGTAGAELYVKTLRDLQTQAKVLSGKSSVDFYVTEIGWPTNTGRWGRSEDDVSLIAAQIYTLSSKLPFLKGVWWYDLIDDGPDTKQKQYNFGLLRYDQTEKPAVKAVSDALRQIE